jgi:hypothetical protein
MSNPQRGRGAAIVGRGATRGAYSGAVARDGLTQSAALDVSEPTYDDHAENGRQAELPASSNRGTFRGRSRGAAQPGHASRGGFDTGGFRGRGGPPLIERGRGGPARGFRGRGRGGNVAVV